MRRDEREQTYGHDVHSRADMCCLLWSLSLSIEKDERLSSVQPHPIYVENACHPLSLEVDCRDEQRVYALSQDRFANFYLNSTEHMRYYSSLSLEPSLLL